MAMKDHINRVPRMRAYITLVDTEQSFIDCVSKDGKVRRIGVQEQLPPLFRWPVEGEEWMISEINGSWALGERVNTQDVPIIDRSQISPGDYALELSPDQNIVLYDQPGPWSDSRRVRHTLPRKYTEIMGNGTDTNLFVVHYLDTTAVVVSLLDVPSGEPISLDVIKMIHASYIWLEFAVAPATNSIQVTVIG